MCGWLARASACCALALAGSVACAQSVTQATEQVEVRLLAAHQVVQPGQTLLVAIEQRIAPHWHTYWRNPGDSGEAMAVEWTLPAGATAGPILWPTPHRMNVGPITNFGYSDQVTLLTELKLPSDLKEGSAARFAAHVSWLVCHEECIPQEATLSLALPVSGTAQVSPDAERLDGALRALPQAMNASP